MRILFTLVVLGIVGTASMAQKIGDIANIVGVRSNQLIGYGLVIGLNGTGDKGGAKFTMQSISNMLSNMNIKVAPDAIKSKNVAAVMITATLPAFAKQGDKININISSIGDAKDLSGGTLVLTPLSAVDGNIYALAQGMVPASHGIAVVSLGVVNGATVEREVPYNLYSQNSATLSLKNGDFSNAIKIQNAINSAFKENIATATSPKTINLAKSQNMSMIEFLAKINDLDVDYEIREKIIVDSKSGTIISGLNIPINPVVVTSGLLTLEITKAKSSDLAAKDIGNAKLSINNGTLSSEGKEINVSTLVQALNRLGALPNSIIAILQALKVAGALDAEIQVL